MFERNLAWCFLTLFWTVSRGNREGCTERYSRLWYNAWRCASFVVPKEECNLLGHSCRECYLRDGPALVLLACNQGHVVFVISLSKNKKRLTRQGGRWVLGRKGPDTVRDRYVARRDRRTPRISTTSFFARHPQISSFRCELAKSTARVQNKASWSVVPLDVSCAFLSDGELGCEADRVRQIMKKDCRTRKTPMLWQTSP